MRSTQNAGLVVGVDTLRDAHTAAVCDRAGQALAVRQFTADPDGYAAVLAWAPVIVHLPRVIRDWQYLLARWRGHAVAHVEGVQHRPVREEAPALVPVSTNGHREPEDSRELAAQAEDQEDAA